MGEVFIDTGWVYEGADEANVSVGVQPFVSAGATGGLLHLTDPFRQKTVFGYAALGGGVGLDLPGELDFSITTKEAPSLGVVYANPLFRDSLSPDDFLGPCLIYQGTLAGAFSLAGYSLSIIFFDVGEGVIAAVAASLGVTIATWGFGSVLTPAIFPPMVIGSCSGFVASRGWVLGSPQAGISLSGGALDSVKWLSGNNPELWGSRWKVTINGNDYSYYFTEKGYCFWDTYSLETRFPKGIGKWKLVGKNKISIFVLIGLLVKEVRSGVCPFPAACKPESGAIMDQRPIR